MKFNRTFLTSFNILFLILLSEISVAQNKYWVELSTESSSITEDITQGSFQLFQKLLNNNEAKIVYYSTFLNAYSINFPQKPTEEFISHSIIKAIHPMANLYTLGSVPKTAKAYGYALEQINASFLTDSLQLNGKGVKIGVIDGGFLAADKETSLAHLIKNDQIVYFSDYLMRNNTDPFYGKRFSHDDHGTEVLSLIAGKDNALNLQLGMATASDFYLARTDHGIRENRLEEDYWVMALESFYEMGIRLINTSLGYTNTFDRKKEDHKKSEVDGKSSMITRAAEEAVKKGMLIVVAAGNDGNTKWEVLSLPADAPHVLTVGATDFSEWAKMSYSSIAPKKLEFIKPNISCFSQNGTSFSTPTITGLAACIWQYDSTLTNLEIIEILQKSAHLASVPNNYIGYGVPDGHKIAKILLGKALNHDINRLQVSSNSVDLTQEEVTRVVYYHKSAKHIVEESGILRRKDKEEPFILNKPKGIKYTTVSFKNEFLLEIEWTD